jgi:DNA replication and repair protein RecF
VPTQTEVTLAAGAAKRARLNGTPLRAAEQLRSEIGTLVFTPDRLAVVKGGPGVRRSYFDRVLGRVLPARADLPAGYAATLGQRNAALRRVGLGHSSRDALEPWTARIAELGAELVDARRETIASLRFPFAEYADALGLPAASLEYVGEPPTAEMLAARLQRDIERAITGVGPHLHDEAVLSDTRDLRVFGSQGEQRIAVLALLLAEAQLLLDRRGAPPLLLLDDVLSELDAGRRLALAERLVGRGQALITATSASALPLASAQVLEVRPGSVTAA